jgi:hypothetical protein
VKITTDGTSAVAGEPAARRKPDATRRRFQSNAVENAVGASLKINDQPMRPLGCTGQVRIDHDHAGEYKDIIG